MLAAVALWAVLSQEQSAPCSVELIALENTWTREQGLTVGLVFTLEQGWHTYWRNPGDSGSPPSVQWKLPPGWTAGPLLFPVPKRIEVDGTVSFGYEDRVILFSRLAAGDGATIGPVALKATVNWVACKDVCMSGSSEVALSALHGHAETGRVDPEGRDAWKALPAADDSYTASATLRQGVLTLTVEAPEPWPDDATEMEFFPADPSVAVHSAPQTVRVAGKRLTIGLKAADFSAPLPERLEGLLVAPKTGPWRPKTRGLVIHARTESSQLNTRRT